MKGWGPMDEEKKSNRGTIIKSVRKLSMEDFEETGFASINEEISFDINSQLS